MAKQLNVNLAMTADTSQASQQLKALQTQLTQLMNAANSNSGSLGLSKEIQNATTMVAKLKTQLDSATSSTGNLDLTKFNESLKRSNTKISDYQKALASLGPAGTQAFSDLAMSITNAEVPLKRSNALLTEFATTLKNTARWQISSSVLHGFMGSLEKAYYYAQDLNESLNNIRIVTGYSSEEMSTFAQQANKAAQELSTTTTKYTDAALIFYQQGLSDDLVKEYTDVTIKMANVSGDTATEVSSYMTAIWNNFNKDGDEAASHYADIMTALGATTASSTAEIAEGLEKFASVADTVGLSFDYASSALATVVANTRQSADVVGTAFKTIFARLDDLELGKTLDDGTDLGTYSQALDKVGVSILDATGNMRDMDDILDDLADKWGTLSGAEQTALAETVAGVRQYTQLISLMNNWDDMETNLQTASNATGTLDEQADIYAESWEAARDRVQAAAEDIYNDLLDDDFFIDMTDNFASILKSIKSVIEGVGGLKGVLVAAGAIITKIYGNDISQALSNVAFSMKMLTSKGKEDVQKLRNDTATSLINNVTNSSTNRGQAEVQAYSQQAQLSQTFIDNAANMSDEQQRYAQLILEQNKNLGEQAIKQGQIADEVQRATTEEENRINAQAKNQVKTLTGSTDISALRDAEKNLQDAYKDTERLKSASMQLNGVWDKNNATESIEKMRNIIEVIPDSVKTMGTESIKVLEKMMDEFDDTEEGVEKIKNALTELSEEGYSENHTATQITALKTALTDLGYTETEQDDIVKRLSSQYEANANAAQDAADANTSAKNAFEQAGAEIQKLSASYTLADGYTALASSVMTLVMAYNSLKSLGSIWSDEDATTGEKILSTITTMGMVLPTLIGLFQKENLAKIAAIRTETKKIILDMAEAGAAKLIAKGKIEEAAATDKLTISTLAYAAAEAAAYWYVAVIIVAITALIALVVALTVAYDKAQHASTAQAESALDAVNKTTKAYNEAKEAADSLRESLESYDDAIEEMESMDKTTEEFKSKLEETNEAAQDLIDTYGLLRSAGDYIVQDGVITFTDQGRSKMEDEIYAKEASTRQQMYNAKIYNEDAQVEAQAEQVRNKYNLGYDINTGHGTSHIQYSADQIQALGEAVAEARAETESFDIEELKANVFSLGEEYGISSTLLDNLDSVITDETLDSFYKLADSVDSATAAAIEYANQLVAIDVQEKYGDKINELSTDSNGDVDEAKAAQMEDAITAMYTNQEGEKGSIGEQIADMTAGMYDTIADNLAVHDSADGFESAIATMIENNVSDIGDQSGDDWLKDHYSDIFGEDKSFDGDQNIQEMLQDALEAQGYDVTNVSDKNGKTVVSTADGQELTYSNEEASRLYGEMIADYIAEQTRAGLEDGLLDEATIDDLMTRISEAGTESGNKFGVDFSTSLYNTISDGTQNNLDLSSVLGEIDADELSELQGMTNDEVLALFGLDETDNFEVMGFTDAQAFCDAFKMELTDWTDTTESIIETLAQESADAFDLDVDDVTDQAKAFAKAYDLAADAAVNLATQNQRMNRGVSNLVDNWDDWKDGLNETDKLSMDYIDTVQELSDCIADLVGASDDLSLSGEFLEDNLDLIEKATTGDEDAINQLGAAVAAFQVDALALDESITRTLEDGTSKLIDTDTFETDKQTVLNGITELQNSLSNLSVGDSVDDILGSEDWVASLNEMAIATQMSVEDMQSILNSLGVQADVKVEHVAQKVEVPRYKTYTTEGEDDGGKYTTTQTTIDGYDEMDGYIDVAQIAVNEKADTPTVTYIGNGTTSSSAKKGSSNKSSSGNSSKTKKTKDYKDVNDEIDRYHEIKESLDDISRELDRTSKSKDRAFGAGKLKALKQENAQLQANAVALQEYNNQVSAQLALDKAKAQSAGWSIDANGNVSNYESNLKAITDEYNAAVAAYNNSAQEEADDTALENAEKAYEEKIKALETYEETSDLLEDIIDQQTENARKIADNQLEGLEYTVELNVKINDFELSYLQELFDNIGDSADGAADRIENLEKQIKNAGEQSKNSKEGIASMFDLLSQYNDNVDEGTMDRLLSGNATDNDLTQIATAISNSDGVLDYDTLMSDIEEYGQNLIDYNQNLRDYRESVYEQLQNAMDEYDEDFDRLDSKIERSSKMIQSYKDLVTAVGKKTVDPTGQVTAALNQNSIKTAESAYNASQSQADYWSKAKADAEKGLAIAQDTGVQADIDYWQDILNNATDKLYESEEDAMSNLQTWVEALGQAFEDEIDQVIQNLNDSVGGLTDIREAFDRAQEIDAEYIDDYQKIYELSKLTRQVTASIDETDNVKAKKALMEYQEKINQYQEDGVEMSEYELEYLQKQYDLEVAKIALDEAQDAKSQVRMTRDSEGNYGYVYTADESQVADAEQSYEDKLYEMQKLNAQYINDLQDNIITMQEEMSEKLQEIAEDDSLSYEEKMTKMQEVTDYYTDRIDYYSKQLGIALDNNKTLYETDWQEYSEKTGYKISRDEDYIDSWNETTIAIETGSESQEEYINNVKTAMQTACDDSQDALSDYQSAVDDATSGVLDMAEETTNALAEFAEDAAEDADELNSKYEEDLGKSMDATQTFTEEYANYINDLITSNEEYISSIDDVLQKLKELAAAEGKSSSSSTSSSSSGKKDSGSSSGSGGGSGASAGTVEGVAAAIWMDGGTASGWYNGSDRSSRLKEKGVTAAQAYINAHGPNGDIYAAWSGKRDQLKNYYYGSFDTGGYTGEWTDGSGKLALLHSKELVLNAQDTENMLDIVDSVRAISDAIDTNALSTLMSSGLTAASLNTNNNGTLEQQVTITAEFPNATDKDSILDAFDNVINLAAQYANRK